MTNHRGNPYRHPGDTVLSHFGYIDGQCISRATDLADMMGWGAADLLRFKQEIEARKAAAAEARRETDRARAGELARPKLDGKSVSELRALADETGLMVKKSARKSDLVDALAAHPPAAEKVIGLSHSHR